MSDIASNRSAYLGAILREVQGAKADILDGHKRIARIIEEGKPENGLGTALAEAERKANELADLLERIATGHLNGMKEVAG